jgi:glycosyltransferase involved in cell wall biosynthesis
MKVAIVGSRRSTRGSDTLAGALAQALAQAGHTVHCIGAEGMVLESAAIRLHPVPSVGRSALGGLRHAWAVRRATAQIVDRFGVDAVLAIESGLSTLVLAGMRRRVPLMVVLPHQRVAADQAPLPGYWRRQMVGRWLAHRVEALAACTLRAAQGAERAYRAPVRHLALQAAGELRDAAARPEPIPESPAVACLGPWTPEHLRWLARGLRLAIAYVPQLRVILIGHEATAAPVPEAIAQQLALPAWTTTLRPQPATPQQRAAWLAAASVCVASATDVYGQPAADAMAAGRAVVATFDSPIADVIEHGRDGWLVERDDGTAMGEALVVLLGHDVLRRQMGEYAHAKARQLGDRRAASARCAAAIERMVTEARAGAPPLSPSA